MSQFERPAELNLAIANWLHRQGSAALRQKSAALSHSYRHGANSQHIDLAAYLTTRLPATYAAIARVLREVQNIATHFKPQSLLDVGAGPGTASWAAKVLWPEMASVTMIEADMRFANLAADLAAANWPATIIQKPLNQIAEFADLIIAAYVFAELDETSAAETALKLWAHAQKILVIVEPGTPRGFARIKNARAALLAAGANVIGPCTHANACPMLGSDWCHFSQRLARSREHMHAKQAHVPFEDEKFSWIAVSREKYELSNARILAPLITTKISTTLKLCGVTGLRTQVIASRDKAAYKQAKKLEWGEVYS